MPTAAQITVNPVNGGGGIARGIDVYLERLGPAARVAGWLSYAYGKSERKTYGLRYPFEYDRPHALNLVGRLGITDRLSLAATARAARRVSLYASGRVSGWRRSATNAIGSCRETDDEGNLAYAVDLGGLENLHRARLPLYARLDLRLTYRHGGPGGRWSAYAEAINVLNRDNGVDIDQRVTANPGAERPTVEEIPAFGFPFVPTVGFRVRF